MLPHQKCRLENKTKASTKAMVTKTPQCFLFVFWSAALFSRILKPKLHWMQIVCLINEKRVIVLLFFIFFSLSPETTKQCWSLWGTSHFLETQRCNWPISVKGIGSRCFLAENDKSVIRWTVSTSPKLINATVMDWNSGSGLYRSSR